MNQSRIREEIQDFRKKTE